MPAGSAVQIAAYTSTEPMAIISATAMREESELMPARCEVELDIFSGMPNPTWTLTNAEGDSFLKQLASLPRTSPRVFSGNLGYRGFIVQCTQGANTKLIRVQNGTVHSLQGVTDVYALDENRQLERWLISTGRPHLEDDLFQIAQRELP